MRSSQLTRTIFSLVLGSLLLAALVGQAQQSRHRTAAIRFFKQNDKNDDDKLSRAEFPKRVLQLFEQIDANGDGFVDLDEAFLVVHGDEDPLVPLHQSKILVAALQAAKVDVTFHQVQGAGHGFGNNAAVDDLVLKFFNQQLKPETR